MPKFPVDLANVKDTLSQRKFKFADVKSQFVKIAFDIYRRADGSVDELWQIQDGPDGTQHIVALYEEDEKIATASAQSPWSVSVKNDDIHVFYKQSYVCKIASSEIGISDTQLVKQYLPNKLAENKGFAGKLVGTLDSTTRTSILAKYPELS